MAFLFYDEYLGRVQPAGEARLTRPTATVRDLIRARVELEVERRSNEAAAALTASGAKLVRPEAAETALNGERGAYGFGSMFMRVDGEHGRHRIDKLFEEAEQAFLKGRYYVLLDDRQAESLDEQVDLARTGEATFLLLTPLQGG